MNLHVRRAWDAWEIVNDDGYPVVPTLFVNRRSAARCRKTLIKEGIPR